MLDASVKLSVTFSALVWRGFIVWSVNVTAYGESVERALRGVVTLPVVVWFDESA